MELDKQQIIDHLRSRGDEATANRAESELHDRVDTEKDSGILKQLGIDPMDLPEQLPGARHLRG